MLQTVCEHVYNHELSFSLLFRLLMEAVEAEQQMQLQQVQCKWNAKHHHVGCSQLVLALT